MSSHRTEAVVAVLITMLIWGTSAVFMRTTALALAPENALALRYVILILMVAPGLWLTGGWRVAREDWPRLFVTGIGMFGSSWFTMQGFARVPAGQGTVFAMIEPIVIALLAFVVLREPLSPRIWLGLAVSFVGAMVLFWPDITASAANPADPLGIFFLLLAPTSWAIYTIGAKPLLQRYSGFAISGWSMLIASPVIFLMASKPYREIAAAASLRTWGELLYLAAFNSLLGSVLWNHGARHLPGAVVGSFLYLVPVIAVAAGWLILDEAITVWLVLGGAIMLAGVALAQSGARGAGH